MTAHLNFENLIYNPFTELSNVITQTDTDPDINFYNDLNLQSLDTQYYDLEEAKIFINNFKQNKNGFRNSFSALHLNARSLNSNICNFKTMIHDLNHEFQILGITESWLTNNDFLNDSTFTIPQYTKCSLERSADKNGGGICAYIHETITYKCRPDISNSNKDIENLFLECVNTNGKNFVVGIFYRPPNGDPKNFSKELDKIHRILCKEDKKIILMGDFNMDCLKCRDDKNIDEFYQNVFKNGMFPIINKPTRVNARSCTAIDNIFINTLFGTQFTSGIIKTDISDHFPIFIQLKDVEIKNQNKFTIVKFHLVTEERKTEFRNKLAELNWNNVKQESNANDAYNTFLKQFLELYNESFPIKEKKIKTKSILNPWFTQGFLKSSKIKQRLYNKFLKSPTEQNKEKYLNFKNMFEKLKGKARIQYFKNQLSMYENNIRKTWDTIKEILGKIALNSKKLPNMIVVEGKSIFEEAEVAKEFNKHFTTIGPKLAKKVKKAKKKFSDYLKSSNTRLKYYPLTIKELDDAVKSIQKNKSPGYDEISSDIILDCYNELRHIIFHLCHKSLSTGIFPDKLKIAKVLPFFKTDDKTLLNNYRPISILPCFSKIFERIMYNRVYDHLISNNLLYKQQFGFQKNHSTEHAILHLVNELTKSFKQQKYTLGVFIDLSKAFDTVNHAVLLEKLKCYGISGIYWKWFQSYLKNRLQYVPYGSDSKTPFLPLLCGVPQGSILGPLLFLLYVNDLPNASNILNPIMFADDTNLFSSDKNIHNLFQTVNQELEKLAEWFSANFLSLNIGKTKYALFHSKRKAIPRGLPPLTINNHNILRQRVNKFLGILIHENLTWEDHIRYVNKKVSKSIGLLYKTRPILNRNSLTQLYFSFINSYLTYGNIVWGSTYKTHLKILHKKQKHASRIIFNENKFSHAEPLLINMNALNIYKLNIYLTACFMYKSNSLRNTPKVFNSAFEVNNNKYKTRMCGKLTLPFWKTVLEKKAISYRGPEVWNKFHSLDNTIYQLHYNSFKARVKSYLLRNIIDPDPFF